MSASLDADEKDTDGNKGPDEKTPRSVSRSRTARCAKRVKSLPWTKDVERVIVPQSDETAGIPKQLKDETSADLTALEKKGLDRRTDHQVETQPRSARPPPWRDKHATIEYGRKSKGRCDKGASMVWLAHSYLEHKAAVQEGVMNFMRHLSSLERV